jgi:hypothetical protein
LAPRFGTEPLKNVWHWQVLRIPKPSKRLAAMRVFLSAALFGAGQDKTVIISTHLKDIIYQQLAGVEYQQ